MKSIVIHYKEIALKGKNRPWFVARLVRNLKEALKDLDVQAVHALPGRIEIVLMCGPRVIVDNGIDATALRRVLDVLERS